MLRESRTWTNTTHYSTDSDEYHTTDEGEVENVVRRGSLSEGIRDIAHLMELKYCGEGYQISPCLRKGDVRILGDVGTRALAGLMRNGKVLCYTTLFTPLGLATPGRVRWDGSAAVPSVGCSVALAGECAVAWRKPVGPTSKPPATLITRRDKFSLEQLLCFFPDQ